MSIIEKYNKHWARIPKEADGLEDQMQPEQEQP